MAGDELTEDDNNLLVGGGERVGDAALGEDDDGTVDGGAEPQDVGVPQQGAPLVHQREPVRVGLPGLDGALRDVGRPVGPARQHLPDPVPERTTMHPEQRHHLTTAPAVSPTAAT